MSYRRLGGLVSASAAVLATLAFAPSAAQAAGSYTVHQCRTPSGAAGPAGAFTTQSQANYALSKDDCGARGGNIVIAASGGGPWPAGSGAELLFRAPSGTKIAGLDFVRNSSGMSAATGLSYNVFLGAGTDLGDPVGRENIDKCGPSNPCTDELSGSPTSLPKEKLSKDFLLMKIGCSEYGPSGDCRNAGRPLVVTVPRVTVNLSDTNVPRASAERGSLFGGSPVDGTRDAEFDAIDSGGGIYRVITRIDGRIPGPGIVRQGADRTLASAQSSCSDAEPSNNNPYEFWAAQPCPVDQQVTLTETIDTTKLSDGAHTVQFEVQDAAGNSTFVPGQARPFRVQNVKPNGIGADRKAKISMYFAKNRKDRLTTRNGIRVVTRGRLRDRNGRGIRGAEIDVYHFVRGKPRLLKTGLKSRRLGRLTLILPSDIYGDPKTGIRTLRYSYTAFRRPKGQKQEKPTTRKTLKVRVLDKYGKPIIPKRYRGKK